MSGQKLLEIGILSVKDKWDIGIGISGIILTLIPIGIAIAVPAYQRFIEIRQNRQAVRTHHIAILTWIRAELDTLYDTLEKKKDIPSSGLDSVFPRSEIEAFSFPLPPRINELKESPNLLKDCPEALLRILWLLGEIAIDIRYMKSAEDDGSTYRDFLRYFTDLHYSPLQDELKKLYEYSHDLGLILKKGIK